MKIEKLLKLLPLCLMLAAALTTGCNDDDANGPIYYEKDTTLHDKQLSIIKRSIRGEWRIFSRVGGLAGLNETIENAYIRFEDDSYTSTYNGEVKTGRLNWRKISTVLNTTSYAADMGPVLGGESTPGEIVKDTLSILQMSMYDGSGFGLKRIK